MEATGTIRVLRIECRPEGSGALRAVVDLQIGDWIVYGWRVIKQKGQRVQIQTPQVSWKDREGRVKYQSLLSIPGELKQRIDIAVISCWEKELERGTEKSD